MEVTRWWFDSSFWCACVRALEKRRATMGGGWNRRRPLPCATLIKLKRSQLVHFSHFNSYQLRWILDFSSSLNNDLLHPPPPPTHYPNLYVEIDEHPPTCHNKELWNLNQKASSSSSSLLVFPDHRPLSIGADNFVRPLHLRPCRCYRSRQNVLHLLHSSNVHRFQSIFMLFAGSWSNTINGFVVIAHTDFSSNYFMGKNVWLLLLVLLSLLLQHRQAFAISISISLEEKVRPKNQSELNNVHIIQWKRFQKNRQNTANMMSWRNGWTEREREISVLRGWKAFSHFRFPFCPIISTNFFRNKLIFRRKFLKT